MLPFLLCVMVLYAPVGPSDGAIGLASVVGVALLALANAAFAWAGSGLARRLARTPFAGKGMAAGRIRSLLNGLVVGFVLADVFALKWPATVGAMFAERPWAVLVDDLLLLLPALVMIVTVMAFWHRYAAAARTVTLSLPRYLWLRLRVELGIVLVPWLVLVLVTDVTAALFWQSPHAELADTVSSLAVLLFMVVFSPVLIRAIWRSTPLPPGPLRDRLEALCRRHRFRCHDILIWHTHNHLSNAGVVGPTGLLRYVMITDSLIGNCTEEEVEAVFAHEVGHIRQHHLYFYMVFALAFLCFYLNLVDVLGAVGLVEPLGRSLLAFDMTPGQGIAMLAFLAFYWVVVFGFVSRRMEQQADLFALEAVDEPTSFLRALAKLGALSGAPPRLSFWRHFSVAHRIEFLERVLERPELAHRFQVFAVSIKIVLIALLVTGAVRLLLVHPDLFGL